MISQLGSFRNDPVEANEPGHHPIRLLAQQDAVHHLDLQGHTTPTSDHLRMPIDTPSDLLLRTTDADRSLQLVQDESGGSKLSMETGLLRNFGR